MLLSSSVGNPWDYLNGTKIAFGIDAGNADKAVGGVYNIIFTGVLAVTVVLIISALVNMILASSPNARTQGKEALKKRFVVLFLLGCASGFLTFIMSILNYIFGIA